MRRVFAALTLAAALTGSLRAQLGPPRLAAPGVVRLAVDRPVVARWEAEPAHPRVLFPGEVTLALPPGPATAPRRLHHGEADAVEVDASLRTGAFLRTGEVSPPQLVRDLLARMGRGAPRREEEVAAVLDWPELLATLAPEEVAPLFQARQDDLLARDAGADATPGGIPGARERLGVPFAGRPGRRDWQGHLRLLRPRRGQMRLVTGTTWEFPWPEAIPTRGGRGWWTVRVDRAGPGFRLRLEGERGTLRLWHVVPHDRGRRAAFPHLSVAFPLAAGPSPGRTVRLVVDDAGWGERPPLLRAVHVFWRGSD